MAEPVKPRAYRSTLRADQARDTRRRVREAADHLFLERGFTDVSIDDIAKQAGVARQTVFNAYGSKVGVLKEVLDVRLVGDDEPLSIAERPEGRRVLTATDPYDAVRRQAELFVETAIRLAPLWRAVTAAAATDAEMTEFLRAYDKERWEGIGVVVDVVARLGALRKGRTRKKAKDAVFVLTNPASALAALELGWSATELSTFYTDCLSALLLETRAVTKGVGKRRVS